MDIPWLFSRCCRHCLYRFLACIVIISSTEADSEGFSRSLYRFHSSLYILSVWIQILYLIVVLIVIAFEIIHSLTN